jgi:DNA mismatch repair protein MutH
VTKKGALIFPCNLYNPEVKESVIAHAKLLEHKTLRKTLETLSTLISAEQFSSVMDVAEKYCTGKAKGKFGNAIEAAHFYYRPNSDAEPDLGWAELKCTGLKKIYLNNKKKTPRYSAKERMVICKINYGGQTGIERITPITKEKFETSHAKAKLESLLIIFYDYQADVPVMDLEVVLVGLWEPSPDELRLISEDWTVIQDYVAKGEAHLLGEGRTKILGACTKGGDGDELVPQANSGLRAKPRAFGLKPSFVTHIFEQLMAKDGRKNEIKKISQTHLTGIEAYRESAKTFEQFILDKLTPFKGMTIEDICKSMGIVKEFNGKHRHANRLRSVINKLMTGDIKKKAESAEEIKKTGIQIKTCRIEPNGSIAEHVSFPNFDFDELAAETEWSDSEFYEILNNRFLFVFLQDPLNGSSPTLDTATFWSITPEELDEARKVWEIAKQKAKEKKYDELPGVKENRVSHVRPHDTKRNYLKNPGRPKLHCFWLRNSFIKDIYLKTR